MRQLSFGRLRLFSNSDEALRIILGCMSRRIKLDLKKNLHLLNNFSKIGTIGCKSKGILGGLGHSRFLPKLGSVFAPL